jgi:hypothetical protein
MTYGLPTGTNIPYGQQQGFPEWVYELAAAFNLKASTYPGHQESERAEVGFAPNPKRQNRGIDWTGSVPDMERFALPQALAWVAFLPSERRVTSVVEVSMADTSRSTRWRSFRR